MAAGAANLEAAVLNTEGSRAATGKEKARSASCYSQWLGKGTQGRRTSPQRLLSCSLRKHDGLYRALWTFATTVTKSPAMQMDLNFPGCWWSAYITPRSCSAFLGTNQNSLDYAAGTTLFHPHSNFKTLQILLRRVFLTIRNLSLDQRPAPSAHFRSVLMRLGMTLVLPWQYPYLAAAFCRGSAGEMRLLRARGTRPVVNRPFHSVDERIGFHIRVT
jgi:hypothetical protein